MADRELIAAILTAGMLPTMEILQSRAQALCCTDQQSGGSSHPHPLSCEANVLRPSKLQHAVQ